MSAKIPTFDSQGKPNGWILPIWSALESPHLQPEQVYLTAIAPRSRKGPHLHLRRRGLFYIISGIVRIYIQIGSSASRGGYITVPERAARSVVPVLPGFACALYNYGDTEALVLNMPSPAWSLEDPDEHPVENWEDPKDWPKS